MGTAHSVHASCNKSLINYMFLDLIVDKLADLCERNFIVHEAVTFIFIVTDHNEIKQ